MKEQDLVKAIGDIEERYVIDAADAAEGKKAEKKSAAPGRANSDIATQ